MDFFYPIIYNQRLFLVIHNNKQTPPPPATDYRITDLGDIRETDDGAFRVVEDV